MSSREQERAISEPIRNFTATLVNRSHSIFTDPMQSRDERAIWLARNVLPHEASLRAWLTKRPVAGLEIDDIIQETYARLSTLASVEGIRDPRSYMFRTAHSVLVTFIRKSRVISIRAFAQFEEEALVDDEPGPEAIAIDRDELTRLGRAIAELPPRIREVFVLRRVEGLSQREVAERLGLSENTVEKHMGGGLRRLADFLANGGRVAHAASRDETRGEEGAHAARDKRRD